MVFKFRIAAWSCNTPGKKSERIQTAIVFPPQQKACVGGKRSGMTELKDLIQGPTHPLQDCQLKEMLHRRRHPKSLFLKGEKGVAVGLLWVALRVRGFWWRSPSKEPIASDPFPPVPGLGHFFFSSLLLWHSKLMRKKARQNRTLEMWVLRREVCGERGDWGEDSGWGEGCMLKRARGRGKKKGKTNEREEETNELWEEGKVRGQKKSFQEELYNHLSPREKTFFHWPLSSHIRKRKYMFTV